MKHEFRDCYSHYCTHCGISMIEIREDRIEHCSFWRMLLHWATKQSVFYGTGTKQGAVL